MDVPARPSIKIFASDASFYFKQVGAMLGDCCLQLRSQPAARRAHAELSTVGDNVDAERDQTRMKLCRVQNIISSASSTAAAKVASGAAVPIRSTRR